MNSNRSSTKEILLSSDFLICFFSFFFLWISFDFFILFPLYIIDKGGNSVDVGIQTAIFFFPSVIFRPVAGWLTDHIGRIKVLHAGSAVMVLTAPTFLFLAGNYQETKYWIAFILFLRGVGFAAFYTAFFTFVTDLSSPENRARIIGLFGISGLLGHGLAPRCAESILKRQGFTGYFVTSGALALLSLLISAFMKERSRTEKPERGEGINIFHKVTFSRSNLIFLPGAFVFGYVIASFSTFGAPYFQIEGNVSVGNFFLAYGFTAGIVRLFFGGIADRYSRRKLVSSFFLLQGAGIFLLVLKPLSAFYIPAAIFSGAAHGILFPSMTAMAVDAHSPRYRGIVTSIFTGTIELGFSLGSYLLGWLVEISNYRTMFFSTGLIAIFIAFYSFTLKQQKGKA